MPKDANQLAARIVAISTGQPADLVYNNIGAYAQDTWKATPRLRIQR